MNKYHIVIAVLLIVFAISMIAVLVKPVGNALAGLGGGIVAAIIGALASFLTWGGANGGPSVGVVYVTIAVLGFIAGGLVMKGVNKIRNKQTTTLPPYQTQPTTIPITPVLQSTPTPQPQPTTPTPIEPEKVKESV